MNGSQSTANDWPPFPFGVWQTTAAALHLCFQIVGKYRLARTPWVNHSWHATFYASPRGLTTSLVPDGDGGIEIEFDFIEHIVHAHCGSRTTKVIPLEPMSVADFHRQFMQTIGELGEKGKPLPVS